MLAAALRASEDVCMACFCATTGHAIPPMSAWHACKSGKGAVSCGVRYRLLT